MPSAIRKLARKQLRSAVGVLGNKKRPLAERIHRMRTSVKRVRALIELARPVVGRPARRADRRLRKVARSTSALRDDEVLLKTFDALSPDMASEVGRSSLRRARGRLAARLRDSVRSFEAERRLAALAASLSRARRETKRWVPRSDGGRVPLLGLVGCYRKARRAMKQAHDKNSGSAFHWWRKAVKAHRYQLSLWGKVLPEESALRFEALERLGDLLGEEHDLTVLKQVVGADRAWFPVGRDRSRLLALIDQRRNALRAEARPLGQRLFAERSSAFRRRLLEQLRQDRPPPSGAFHRPARAHTRAVGSPGWPDLRAV